MSSSSAAKKSWKDSKVRAARIAAIKARWQDPEYRAKRAKAVQSKEYKKKLSRSRRLMWQDPEYRKKREASSKKYWATPEAKKEASLRTAKQWADGKRDKSAASKKSLARWADLAFRTKMKPISKLIGSKRAQKLWSDPDKRKKLTDKHKVRASKPVNRKANSDRLKAFWADPENHARMVETRKHLYTPERMEKMHKACRGKTPWNKGLTKETDPRLRANSDRLKGQIPDYGKYRAWYDNGKRKIHMRSRWEVVYAMYLDRQSIKWLYEPKRFEIGEGRWTGRTYIPDFYLTATKEYIEIKGRLSEENRLKMAIFRCRFPKVKLTVLYFSHLFKLGLVDCHHRAIY